MAIERVNSIEEISTMTNKDKKYLCKALKGLCTFTKNANKMENPIKDIKTIIEGISFNIQNTNIEENNNNE